VLDDVSLRVAPGEFVAIRRAVGQRQNDAAQPAGRLGNAHARQVTRTGKTRTDHQEGGLLPWLTVERNIALGLREIRDRSARDRELSSLLALIGMENFRRAYPHQLSGGMRQRVELARALAGASGRRALDGRTVFRARLPDTAYECAAEGCARLSLWNVHAPWF
jgi:ABC-type nitrate/sulfonate/bicarbonate transport system ATPase subunit